MVIERRNTETTYCELSQELVKWRVLRLISHIRIT